MFQTTRLGLEVLDLSISNFEIVSDFGIRIWSLENKFGGHKIPGRLVSDFS
jgi:hypothetical protein